MKGEKGAALLLAIAIIAFLSLAVVEFQREAKVELNYASNSLFALEAEGMVRSGAAAGIAMLKTGGNTDVDRSQFWYSQEGQPIPVGQNIVSVQIEDQYGKFPIGALLDKNKKAVPKVVAAYKRLIDALELEDVDSDELAWALVDWIDDDATDDQYEFNENFTVPDSLPEHLDELGRITGYNRLPKFALDKILSHLDTRAEAFVNVNTASVPVLMALSPTLSREDAQALYDRLTETPAKSESAVADLLPRAGRALGLKFTSTRLKLILEADVRDVRAKAEAVVEKNSKGEYLISEWIKL